MSLKLQVDQQLARRAGPPELKLQLGCGTNLLPDWLNTDAMPSPLVDYLDCTRRFPFSDNAFAAVFCEHMIEHMEKAQAWFMVQEIFRVLRPQGRFRVVTPSLENLARLVLEPESAAAQNYLGFCRRFLNDPQAQVWDAINLAFYGHGHRHIYGADELGAMLRQAGFVDLRTMPAGTYGEPIFNGVDGHGKVVGEDVNAFEAFAIEAGKP